MLRIGKGFAAVPSVACQSIVIVRQVAGVSAIFLSVSCHQGIFRRAVYALLSSTKTSETKPSKDRAGKQRALCTLEQCMVQRVPK